MNQQVYHILKAARERLSDARRWCRKAHARTPRGRSCPPTSNQAARWCAIGALYANVQQHDDEGTITAMYRAMGCLEVAAQSLYGELAAEVNDKRAHWAVLAMYDAALADLERQVGA
jgi:hypothetical protein